MILGTRQKRKKIRFAKINESWESLETVEKTKGFLSSFPPVQFSKRKPVSTVLMSLVWESRTRSRSSSLLITEQGGQCNFLLQPK